jgi:outer membrane autotransporter protein
VGDLLLARLEDAAGTDHAQPFHLAAATDDLHGMMPAATEPNGAWVQGFGNWGQTESNGNSASSSTHTSGLLIGADGALGDAWKGGGAIGYSDSTIDEVGRATHAGSNNYHAAIYAGTSNRTGPSWKLGSSFSWHAIDSTRQIDFSSFSDTARANYNVASEQLFADISYPLNYGNMDTRFAPFARLSYVHQTTSGFAEQGGAAALNIDNANSDTLQTTLGMRGHQEGALPAHDIKKVSIDGMFGWQHLEGDVTPTSTARFTSGSDSFTVDGAPMARDAFVYDAAFRLALDPNASIGLRYAGQLATDDQSQSITGQFQYQF